MASRDPHRPNILFILSDDQGAWALGCGGNAEIQTPALDRLARAGVRCDSFFCASPVCSPARASILTGRIPSQHGIHDWLRAGNYADPAGRETQRIAYLQGQLGYTEVLAQDGYACGLSGKWHLGDSHCPQQGHSYWEVHATGGGPYYGAPMIHDGAVYAEPRYVTNAITENALAFLEQQAAAPAPFYLGVHYTAPHSPWERGDHPAEIYDGYFADCPFDSVPQETPHPWQIKSAPMGYDGERRRTILSGYFSAVTAMDRDVGRLLDWLAAHGLSEHTLVIFSGDNGMNMGHHGIFGKGNGTFPQNMFDTSVKVPMIIARPGRMPQGQVCSALLSHTDIFPTLLDYLGLEAPDCGPLPGQSFAALLRGQALDGREAVVICDEYGPVRMIRTREWKYVHRYPYGPHELYDLVNDPGERHNLHAEPAQRRRCSQLKAELEDWFARYADPRVDGRHEPVTGMGQLGPAGPAGRGEQAFADDWALLRAPEPQPAADGPPARAERGAA